MEEIDSSQFDKEDEFHAVMMFPYDAGDRINFRYELKVSPALIKRKREELINELSDEDYKIIKSFEAFLKGEPIPYNIAELSSRRNHTRALINELEQDISDHA